MGINRSAGCRKNISSFHTLQKEKLRVPAYQATITPLNYGGAKGQAIPTYDPENTHYGKRSHAFHHGCKNILSLHHATIKQSQARNHKHDQCGGSKHPGVMATKFGLSNSCISLFFYFFELFRKFSNRRCRLFLFRCRLRMER